MKKIPHTKHNENDAHGSVSSYIVGFILSLMFTIIPYFLVVNKVLTGRSLVLGILTIAIIQMIIQLVFFLHLGRGPKPFYNVVFFFATALTIIVVVGASLLIMDNLYRTMMPEEIVIRQAQEENIAQIGGKETGACTENRSNHPVVIGGSEVAPRAVEARRCDTISFINEDSIGHEIAFGVHPDDVSYGGLYEVPVASGKTRIITLNEIGEFTFHSHDDESFIGTLVVTEEESAVVD